MTRAGSVFLVLAMLVASCTSSSAASNQTNNDTDNTGGNGQEVEGTTTTTDEPCRPSVSALTLDSAPDSSTASLIALSESVFTCTGVAVVVGEVDVATARMAAAAAVELEAPLLAIFTPSDVEPVSDELERLEVERVVTVGLDAATVAQLNVDDTEEIAFPSTTSTTTTTTTSTVPSTTTTEPPTTTTEATPASSADTAESSTTSVTPSTTAQPTTTVAFDPVDSPAANADDGPVVVFRPGSEIAAYLVSPAVVQGGGEVVVADPSDVDNLRAIVAGRTDVQFSGDLTPTEEWQLALASSDTEVFGGGTEVFPHRRIVAYYGNPLTFRLGLLGESNPERAVERVTERAALYNEEGLPPALPGFEIIVTVASNKPGDDGNYSNEMELEVVRPWIDAAMANEVSVILDLQPGRTDFLTQAKLYEEFLRLPNVGLALDPEWRLEPDQRHLRQIGQVGADEINSVVDYLTELVREETLPQKILILHQFNTHMLPERELVKTPPELAVVVHVDGQGPLGSKYGTWDAMLEAPIGPDQNLWWAWKNFIDEDFPTATPGQVNRVEPLPVIVTYQ